MFSFRSLSKEQRQDILTGIILLIFGIWMLMQTNLFTIAGRMGDPGPSLIPRIISTLVISLSIILLLNTVIAVIRAGRSAAAQAEADAQKSTVDNKAILLTFCLFIYYFFALRPLGYITCSIIYLFLQMLVLADKPSKKQLALFAFLSAVVPVLINNLFVNFFYLFLPRGTIW